jgi:hypothetical protein
MMLHKLRRAMINLERESLCGEVEVDERDPGRMRGSRQLKGRKVALVLVAVEKRGRVAGRARMAVIPDFKRATLLAFLSSSSTTFAYTSVRRFLPTGSHKSFNLCVPPWPTACGEESAHRIQEFYVLWTRALRTNAARWVHRSPFTGWV